MPSELNPNHPVTREMHDHWHKIAALLMIKMGVTKTEITLADIAKMAEQQLNIAIYPRDDLGVIQLFLLNDEEARKLAREQGGLSV